jgi:hypothetical protein
MNSISAKPLQEYAMLRKIRVAVVKSTRPVYLAALSATLFFAAGLQTLNAHPGVLARHAIYSGIFFACIWAACRLFAMGLDRRLKLEGYSTETAGDMVYTFVIYLEVIKHVVGLSFTLGWIAGVMFCWDYLGDRFFLVPLAASLGVSLVAFVITYGFSSFTDQLRWPVKDEE